MHGRSPLICTIGDLVVDVVVSLARDPQRGTDTPASIRRVRGGSAANLAVASVAAGGNARFLGQVGDDADGLHLISEMVGHGVDAQVARNGTTGSVVVLVDGAGERSFLTDRGASVHLGYVNDDALDCVDILHVPLYSLLRGELADTTQRLIGDAIDRSIPVSISTSSVSAVREFGRAEFLALIKNIAPAFVFANQPEARSALRSHPWFVGADATVVTAGAGAARLTQPDGSDFRIAPTQRRATDTTGAGDYFTAGVLVEWLRGKSPTACLEAGHNLAATVLDQVGASQKPPPSSEEINNDQDQ